MRHLSYALALLVGLTACQDTPTQATAPSDAPDTQLARQAGSQNPVASARGNGHRFRNGRALVFTFNAVQRADGSAEGKYYLDWQDLGPALDHQRLQVEVDVTCMSVSGNRAWIAGIVTEVDGPLVVEGTVSYFYVTDGGEGAGAVDEISQLALNEPAGEDDVFCTDQPLLLSDVPIERGNAQVRSH